MKAILADSSGYKIMDSSMWIKMKSSVDPEVWILKDVFLFQKRVNMYNYENEVVWPKVLADCKTSK